jgi:hypothetical protein
VQVSTFALGALANNWPVLWAVAYAGLLGGLQWNLTTLCTIDPPADPGFTGADGLAMLNRVGDPVAADQASLKLAQLLLRRGWYQFCECTGGGTPAPPAPPAAPSGLPTTTTGITQTVAPCGTIGPLTGTSTNGSIVQLVGSYLTTPETFIAIPAGATNVRFTQTAATVSGAADQSWVQYAFGDAASVIIGTNHYSTSAFGPNATLVTNVAVPANATGIRIEVAKVNGTTGVQHITVTADFYCGSAPGGTQGSPGTCTPDAATLGMLQQILDMVTLVQRQVAPFGYILSTVHAGLTGNGSFAVHGLLGLQIAVTAGLPTAGSSAGTPVEYFTDSFVSLGSADGYPHSQRVDHSPQLWFPPDAGAFTLVGYTLRPGLTVTITEVVREP